MSKARELASLGNAYSDGALSNRNLIINGAMQVAQRGTSVTGIASGNTWTADRFVSSINVGVMNQTVEQDAPDGLSNSLKFEITTAETPQSGDFIILEQRFEGQDLQRIAKGTASAQKVTLSFWVKSNKTGTYTVEFDDNDNQRSIERQYTVDASGVWEFKTVTYDEDTVGIFDNDNGFSGRLMWWLAAGSSFTSGTLATSWEATVNANRAVGNVNLADTIGNYFQITGVQLEVGDTATPFEHRSYGQELALCQRYLYRLNGNSSDQTMIAAGYFYNTAATRHIVHYPVTMRGIASVSANGLDVLRDVANDAAVTLESTLDESIYSCGLNIGNVDATTIGEGAILRLASSTSAYIEFDAEL